MVGFRTNDKIVHYIRGCCLKPRREGAPVGLKALQSSRESKRSPRFGGQRDAGHQETFVIENLSNIADDFFNNEACAVRRGSFR